ncbi:MAG: translation initiation factor IF-2, partial [Christensenellales bacterium]
NVTDIVVIVVAGDDGVMPQTVEAINHAKAAGVQIIVAINKMDKQQANPDRVLQQLAEHEILVEEWGGTVPAVEVSAHTGMGIQDLLENIVTVAEIMELKANPSRTAKGVIIESRLDKGTGPVATILVQTGTLKVSDFIVAGTATGKIRAMFDDQGKRVTQAPPSTAVSILGLQSVPNAGDQIFVVNDEKLSKKVAEERKNKEKIEKLKIKKVTLEDVFNKLEEGKTKDLNLIIKADVQGSVEALKQSLIKLSNEEVKVNVVHGGVGAISESDIMLADTSDAIIIGFNIRPDNKAKALAERSEVEIKLYKIIYDVIDDIDKAIKGLLAPKFKETYLGTAEVRAVFKVSGAGSVAGCMVKDGKVMKNARVRLIRDSVEIFDTTIASLKRFKDDVREVAAGFECGISLDKYNDIKEGDVIEAYLVEEEKQ